MIALLLGRSVKGKNLITSVSKWTTSKGALARLKDAGYPVALGPFHFGGWNVAFVKVFDGIWLDIFRMPKKKPKKKTARKRR